MEKIYDHLNKYLNKEGQNLKHEIHRWLNKNRPKLEKKDRDFLINISLEIWLMFEIRGLFDKKIITQKKTKKIIFEFLQDENFEKIIGELNKATKLIRLPKPLFPSLPVVKVDWTTSTDLLPLFLTKGIFSKFNTIPHINDIINKEEKKIGRKPTAKEKRDLEVRIGEYRKDGHIWREFSKFAIGFGYEHFTEYIQKIEKEYQKKEEEVKPFLFPGTKREIGEKLKKVRLYKKGQALAYGILGETFLQKQKECNGISLLKENAVYYIGRNPNSKSAYHEVKEILNSLRWLEYRIVSRDNLKIKAWGNFIYNILEKPKEYVLDINSIYVGCIQFFTEDKKLRSKKERKELFSRGYFNFPMKALAISGDYSTSTQEFRNYLLREKGNTHLKTKEYKVLSQKIGVYIRKACLIYKRRNENYKEFVDNILPVLIRDKFIAKIDPPLNKLKALSSKTGYETNLRIYMQKIEELDKKLEQVLRQKLGNSLV